MAVIIEQQSAPAIVQIEGREANEHLIVTGSGSSNVIVETTNENVSVNSPAVYLGGGGGGGTTDHGALTGLADDDHLQYHNDTRGDARYYIKSAVDTALAGKADTAHIHDDRYYTETEVDTLLGGKQNAGNYVLDSDPRLTDSRDPNAHTHAVTDLSDSTLTGRNLITAVDAGAARGVIGAAASTHSHSVNDLNVTGTPDGTKFLRDDHTWAAIPVSDGGGGGVTSHSALTDLNADDHPQYHNDTRGDLRYYTQTQIDTALSGKQDSGNYIIEGDPRLTDSRDPNAHTHPAADISDSTITGRSVVTATDAAAARTAIGAGTSNLVIGTTATTAKAGDYVPAWGEITSKPATFPPDAHTHDDRYYTETEVDTALGGKADTSHTHTAANISDSTLTGRNVLTAIDAAAARTAIGAGTSNLVIGTTATTAKAGDYVPTWGEVTSKPATFPPDAHTHDDRYYTETETDTLLAGKSNTGHTHTAANISDSTIVGRNVLTAVDAGAARTAIGAGTSNLAIGTTSTTAKAGDYAPTWTEVTSKPTTFTPSAHNHPVTEISDSTTIGRSLVTAATALAARTTIDAPSTTELDDATAYPKVVNGHNIHGVYFKNTSDPVPAGLPNVLIVNVADGTIT